MSGVKLIRFDNKAKEDGKYKYSLLRCKSCNKTICIDFAIRNNMKLISDPNHKCKGIKLLDADDSDIFVSLDVLAMGTNKFAADYFYIDHLYYDKDGNEVKEW